MPAVLTRWLVSLAIASLAMGLVLVHAARAQEAAGGAAPYRAEEVAFDSVPGVRLAGTLTLPAGKPPFAAVVLISGSGPHDRDETILGHKPFRVLADDLTRRGIAVLRTDDRGVGGSTGGRANATTADFAKDTEAAVRFLRTRHDIDPHRIGLIGHSEGGVIAPMVADADPKIAFLVLMAGTAVPGAQALKAQREAIDQLEGVPAAAAALNERVVAAGTGAASPAEALARIKAAAPDVPDAQAYAAAAQLGSPWMRFFLAYDPGPALRKLHIPVLALYGSKDSQVVTAQNLPAMREALGTDAKATVVELPGLNHLFQTAGTGSPTEYARIAQDISPEALKVIGDWIVAQTAR